MQINICTLSTFPDQINCLIGFESSLLTVARGPGSAEKVTQSKSFICCCCLFDTPCPLWTVPVSALCSQCVIVSCVCNRRDGCGEFSVCADVFVWECVCVCVCGLCTIQSVSIFC